MDADSRTRPRTGGGQAAVLRKMLAWRLAHPVLSERRPRPGWRSPAFPRRR